MQRVPRSLTPSQPDERRLFLGEGRDLLAGPALYLTVSSEDFLRDIGNPNVSHSSCDRPLTSVELGLPQHLLVRTSSLRLVMEIAITFIYFFAKFICESCQRKASSFNESVVLCKDEGGYGVRQS